MRRLLLGLLLVGTGVVSADENPPKQVAPTDTKAQGTDTKVQGTDTKVQNGEDPDCNCRAGGERTRIIGGHESVANAYPFVAALTLTNKRPFCGATIVTKNHVITAAQCTISYKDNVDELRVLVGAHDFTKAVTQQFVPVMKTIEHPLFKVDGNNNHDISIVLLKMDLIFMPIVKPACIINKWTDMDNKNLLMAGWGIIRKEGLISKMLKEVDIPVLAWEDCQRFYPGEIFRFKSQFCTYKKGKDSCQGDAGGPVMYYEPVSKKHVFVGVISFGRDCASESPSVNSNVGYYLGWINGVVNATSKGLRKTCSSLPIA